MKACLVSVKVNNVEELLIDWHFLLLHVLLYDNEETINYSCLYNEQRDIAMQPLLTLVVR